MGTFFLPAYHYFLSLWQLFVFFSWFTLEWQLAEWQNVPGYFNSISTKFFLPPAPLLSFPSSSLMWCLYATLTASAPSPIFLKLRTWIETRVCVGLMVGIYNPPCVAVVQLLSCAQLFVTPWTAACQASLSFTISCSLLKPHVYWVSNAIQPSHPLSTPFPPALNLSQHQSTSVQIKWFHWWLC